MEFERAMRLVAVQEDGDRRDGDVGERQRREHSAPPGKIENAGIKQGLHSYLLDNRAILRTAPALGIDAGQCALRAASICETTRRVLLLRPRRALPQQQQRQRKSCAPCAPDWCRAKHPHAEAVRSDELQGRCGRATFVGPAPDGAGTEDFSKAVVLVGVNP